MVSHKDVTFHRSSASSFNYNEGSGRRGSLRKCGLRKGFFASVGVYSMSQGTENYRYRKDFERDFLF